MADRPPTRPVVAHHGALGDTIQLTALLQALSQRWGGPCSLLAGPAAAPRLLAGLESVGEVRTLGTRKRPYWTSPHQWGLVRWLRGGPPSPCYVVERWRHPVAPWSRLTRMEWLLSRAGIPPERWITTEALPRCPLEHGVDYQLRLARLDPPGFSGAARDSLPEPSVRPRLAVRPSEAAECRSWLARIGCADRPLVLFQTEARRSRKRGRWPRERWLALARAVLEELPDGQILLLGTSAEREPMRALARDTGNSRVRVVAGDLPLRRLLALLTLAHSCVSIDTGPAHAAAALDCPLVVLAGTADPRRNRPLGRPGTVEVVTAFGDRPWPESGVGWFREHDVEGIGMETVLGAWRRVACSRLD